MSMDLVLPSGSLEAYQSAVAQIPVLTAEQERELAFRLQRDNDLEAARKLVVSHLRFVGYIARSYRGYGLPEADLIQEGSIGLMKAVKRFDPEKGNRTDERRARCAPENDERCDCFEREADRPN